MKTQMVGAVVLAMASLTICAQEQRFGVGVMIGEPTGASIKYRLDQHNAIDGGIGWSFADHDAFNIQSDYLWHNYDLLSGAGAGDRLSVYYGVGARVKFSDDAQVGVRGPIGVSYILEQIPLDVFVEAGPVLDFTPNVRLHYTAAIGARFWF